MSYWRKGGTAEQAGTETVKTDDISLALVLKEGKTSQNKEETKAVTFWEKEKFGNLFSSRHEQEYLILINITKIFWFTSYFYTVVPLTLSSVRAMSREYAVDTKGRHRMDTHKRMRTYLQRVCEVGQLVHFQLNCIILIFCFYFQTFKMFHIFFLLFHTFLNHFHFDFIFLSFIFLVTFTEHTELNKKTLCYQIEQYKQGTGKSDQRQTQGTLGGLHLPCCIPQHLLWYLEQHRHSIIFIHFKETLLSI